MKHRSVVLGCLLTRQITATAPKNVVINNDDVRTSKYKNDFSSFEENFPGGTMNRTSNVESGVINSSVTIFFIIGFDFNWRSTGMFFMLLSMKIGLKFNFDPITSTILIMNWFVFDIFSWRGTSKTTWHEKNFGTWTLGKNPVEIHIRYFIENLLIVIAFGCRQGWDPKYEMTTKLKYPSSPSPVKNDVNNWIPLGLNSGNSSLISLCFALG